ncbi:hypothetical protein NQ315_002035 [Exocentrus adspersus]|uniref:THAP-type domain-containing protein n=1 Tax=Exocentrus adspersus TaxID=1586481 RepID=A0AAV8VFV7_9CUCU|nr:hypothetical protein NQ315_002035 [Exocentrus adspersus]
MALISRWIVYTCKTVWCILIWHWYHQYNVSGTMKCCFVPGCKSGYKSSKGIKASIFSAPKNLEILEKWRRAIPRGDKVLSEQHFVCELHFHSEDVIRYKEIVLPDGNITLYKENETIFISVPSTSALLVADEVTESAIVVQVSGFETLKMELDTLVTD